MSQKNINMYRLLQKMKHGHHPALTDKEHMMMILLSLSPSLNWKPVLHSTAQTLERAQVREENLYCTKMATKTRIWSVVNW